MLMLKRFVKKLIVATNLNKHKTVTLCKFHSEMTPSMVVDFKRHEFYCLGCSAKGRIVYIENINVKGPRDE